MFKELLILSLSATVCLAGPFIGACKDPKTPKDFSLEKFAGTWYEIESSASIGHAARKCSTYKIEYKGKNKASLLHKYYSKVLSKIKSDYSDIAPVKSSEPAKLQVSPLKSTGPFDTKWPLWIVDTDYDTYAIAYSCQKKIVTRIEHVYIFSRTKTIDDKKKMDIYDLVKKKDLPVKNLVDVPQEDKHCEEAD